MHGLPPLLHEFRLTDLATLCGSSLGASIFTTYLNSFTSFPLNSQIGLNATKSIDGLQQHTWTQHAADSNLFPQLTCVGLQWPEFTVQHSSTSDSHQAREIKHFLQAASSATQGLVQCISKGVPTDPSIFTVQLHSNSRSPHARQEASYPLL